MQLCQGKGQKAVVRSERRQKRAKENCRKFIYQRIRDLWIKVLTKSSFTVSAC